MNNLGLKFERTDNLDKLFESFAVDPEKTVASKEEAWQAIEEAISE